MEFQKFSKIARWSRDVIITEKLDGTNAQILITEDGEFFTGSRNRWITPENDNYGFSRWAHEHREELMQLGVGRHFGEWWGSGIQRKYNLSEKRFSLFNVSKWKDVRPACCDVVPLLWQGSMDDIDIESIMLELKLEGSVAAPGFMNPEGIVIFHTAGGYLFKKTFEHDTTGKGEQCTD